MKTSIQSLAIVALALVGFALSPRTHAVNPPPDGGYPGFNTAEGQNALLSLDTSTGLANTAVGWLSLKSSVDASFNTAVGAGTLVLNSGDQNTAIGAAALLLNSIGAFNTAVGAVALLNNAGGDFNTATGTSALQSNTEGDFNTANGFGALDLNTTGDANTAIGASALQSNIGGNDNTAIGLLALGANTGGSSNTAVGSSALPNNTDGLNNVVIGATAGGAITTASNVICIGTNLDGENISNSCYIGNIFNQTSASGVAVFVNASGRLGTMTSSLRFKEEIKPMERASEALFSLKPVSFRYKKEIDVAGTSQFGLVAEDVEKVNSDLVVRDKEGRPYSVRYDQVNAMLLNEFLKEHRRVEQQDRRIREQEITITDLKKEMETVVVRLKEHDSKFVRVSEQLQRSPSEPQLVQNR